MLQSIWFLLNKFRVGSSGSNIAKFKVSPLQQESPKLKKKKNTRLIFVYVLQAISHLNQSRTIRELSFSIINATVIESQLFNDVELLFDQRYGAITLANNQLTRNNKGLNTSRVSFDNRHSIKETSRRKISKFRNEQERRKASSVTSSSGSLPGFMIGLCRPSDALRDQDFRWSVCNSKNLSPILSSLRQFLLFLGF